jgi:hypothetical protein
MTEIERQQFNRDFKEANQKEVVVPEISTPAAPDVEPKKEVVFHTPVEEKE